MKKSLSRGKWLLAVYMYGPGVPNDTAKALTLIQKSADKGNAQAEIGLGYLMPSEGRYRRI
jgi:TPR repeat protein